MAATTLCTAALWGQQGDTVREAQPGLSGTRHCSWTAVCWATRGLLEEKARPRRGSSQAKRCRPSWALPWEGLARGGGGTRGPSSCQHELCPGVRAQLAPNLMASSPGARAAGQGLRPPARCGTALHWPAHPGPWGMPNGHTEEGRGLSGHRLAAPPQAGRRLPHRAAQGLRRPAGPEAVKRVASGPWRTGLCQALLLALPSR